MTHAMQSLTLVYRECNIEKNLIRFKVFYALHPEMEQRKCTDLFTCSDNQKAKHFTKNEEKRRRLIWWGALPCSFVYFFCPKFKKNLLTIDRLMPCRCLPFTKSCRRKIRYMDMNKRKMCIRKLKPHHNMSIFKEESTHALL